MSIPIDKAKRAEMKFNRRDPVNIPGTDGEARFYVNDGSIGVLQRINTGTGVVTADVRIPRRYLLAALKAMRKRPSGLKGEKP